MIRPDPRRKYCPCLFSFFFFFAVGGGGGGGQRSSDFSDRFPVENGQ